MSKKRLIWFCHGTIDSIAQSQVLARLRDEIGLTTIMPENPICHTSGFSVSNELAQRGPFEDWRTRQNLWPKAADGIYPPVAGIVSGFDDTPLLRLIESAHNAGIEVWGHLGASIGAAVDWNPHLQTSDAEMEAVALKHLTDSQLTIVPTGEVRGGEAEEIHGQGGRYLSIVGGHATFHQQADRWPDAVNLTATAEYAAAMASIVMELTKAE